MRIPKWQLLLGVGLVALSAVLYLIHFFFFHDAHHIFIYLVGDIAFVPIEVLLVTLIIHQLLTIREKRQMLDKLNMVIGAFFSEVGRELLTQLATFDPDAEKTSGELSSVGTWSERELAVSAAMFRNKTSRLDAAEGSLPRLRDFLVGRRSFLLRLLENPNLLEHESFTELLWAVFHLTEELSHRSDVTSPRGKDLEHLSGDMRRVHGILISEWLCYMRHLKKEYPYLFSLAARTNPFDASASVELV